MVRHDSRFRDGVRMVATTAGTRALALRPHLIFKPSLSRGFLGEQTSQFQQGNAISLMFTQRAVCHVTVHLYPFYTPLLPIMSV